ncbi:hypothetical protein [Peribacillus muralis]|uniref:hypothetical protein n=1 Tax=Peribacillus muralis TaxID=264697 RepID=UPI003D01B002
MAEIKEGEETKRKEIIKAQKIKEEERIIAEKKAKDEAERKERERVSEKQRQAQLAAQQKPQKSQQKQTKSNDLDGDGFIGQYEWSKMSSREQKQWTKDLTECVDSGKDDCRHE